MFGGTKILIVSDDPQECALLKRIAENKRQEAVVVGGSLERNEVPGIRPGLVLIDIPNREGNLDTEMTLLRSRFRRTPILGMIGLEQLLTFAELDYFQAKDFKPLAQLRSHSDFTSVERRRGERRRSVTQAAEEKRPKALFHIDTWSKQIFLYEQPLKLSPKEYELLSLLASSPGRVFSDEEIVAHVWPHNPRANSSDVEQFIYRVRKKMKENPFDSSWIVTVKGFGYKFAKEVTS